MKDPFVVGVDVGGTKTQLARVDRSGTLESVTRPSMHISPRTWGELPVWLIALLDEACPGWRDAPAVVIGAHGCDSEEQIEQLRWPLVQATSGTVSVLNDAQLVVPAAGAESGIGVIVGTGSIAASTLESGQVVTAGGWGWILGDEGSAPALVREGIKATLARSERGDPIDPLGARLFAAFDVDNAPDLLIQSTGTMGKVEWGRFAPEIFTALEEGSEDARLVIHHAAAHLRQLVERLVARGADPSTVVVAGGVATNQPVLVSAFADELRRLDSGVQVITLSEDPVHGAVALALAAAGWTSATPLPSGRKGA